MKDSDEVAKSRPPTTKRKFHADVEKCGTREFVPTLAKIVRGIIVGDRPALNLHKIYTSTDTFQRTSGTALHLVS